MLVSLTSEKMSFDILDRQTDRQADRQTDRQTDRQIDRQIDRSIDRKILIDVYKGILIHSAFPLKLGEILFLKFGERGRSWKNCSEIGGFF